MLRHMMMATSFEFTFMPLIYLGLQSITALRAYNIFRHTLAMCVFLLNNDILSSTIIMYQAEELTVHV